MFCFIFWQTNKEYMTIGKLTCIAKPASTSHKWTYKIFVIPYKSYPILNKLASILKDYDSFVATKKEKKTHISFKTNTMLALLLYIVSYLE